MKRQLPQESSTRLRRPSSDPRRPAALPPVAASPGMRGALELAELVAASRLSVVVLGETGVGKELIAQHLHARSLRSGRMQSLNCAALPEQLVESHLFGHLKGAFTGADRDRKGAFEVADEGTLFLDEIGDLSLPAQAKLLRTLESREVYRVGSFEPIPVDVRLVTATHRHLEAMVKRGAFRRDLLHRLNAVIIEVPPLRARPEDIEPLIERFLTLENVEQGRAVTGMEPDVLDLFRRYAWPGNVRELRNAIARAVVVSQTDRIRQADLPARIRSGIDMIGPAAPDPELLESRSLRDLVADYEERLITHALRRAGWNRTRAAKLLRIPKRTLDYKLHKYRSNGAPDAPPSPPDE